MTPTAFNTVQDKTQIVTLTILINASLSDACIPNGARPVALFMPAAWTAASIVVLPSPDGGVTFPGPAQNEAGTIGGIVVGVDDVVALSEAYFGCARAPFKLGSVTVANLAIAEPQLAERKIKVLLALA